MAISAQRFKFLDKETNVPTQDLLSLKDNQVYNTLLSTAVTSLMGMKDISGILGQLNGQLSGGLELGMLSGLNGISGLLPNGLPALPANLQSVVTDTLSKLPDIKMPDALKGAAGMLNQLNPTGVQDFFTDALKVGLPTVPQNLNVLQLAGSGLSLGDNSLAGLTSSLVLSSAPILSNALGVGDLTGLTKIAKLEVLAPKLLSSVNVANVYDKVTSLCADAMTAFSPVTVPPVQGDLDSLLDLVRDGEGSSVVTGLRASEIDYFQKEEILAKLDLAISSVPETSQEYGFYLQARGDIQTLPLISDDRRNLSLQYSSIKDQLGTLSQDLVELDLGQVDRFNFTPTQNAMFEKIELFQQQVKTNSDILTREAKTGSFSDVDFTSILPVPTIEELSSVSSASVDNACHRTFGLHPTTEAFLAEEFTYVPA